MFSKYSFDVSVHLAETCISCDIVSCIRATKGYVSLEERANTNEHMCALNDIQRTLNGRTNYAAKYTHQLEFMNYVSKNTSTDLTRFPV